MKKMFCGEICRVFNILVDIVGFQGEDIVQDFPSLLVYGICLLWSILDKCASHENLSVECSYILIPSDSSRSTKKCPGKHDLLSPWTFLNEVLMKWFAFSADKRSLKCLNSVFPLT